MFQSMNYVLLNRLRLKVEMYLPSDCKDIGIITFQFVAKAYLLCYDTITLECFRRGVGGLRWEGSRRELDENYLLYNNIKYK